MAWAPLLLQLEEMRSKGLAIVTKKEVENMNYANDDLMLSSEQLSNFLKYEHSISRIVYFDEVGLNRFVIIQPMALVDILKSFVTDERFWPDQHKPVFYSLRETGQIQRDNLLKLWSEEPYKNRFFTTKCQDFVIELLCRLDILIKPSYDNAEYFFVPCMIQSAIPTSYFESLVSSYDKNKIICLSYKLTIEIVPPSFIFRLIGSMISMWSLKKDGRNTTLYCKAAIVSIDENNDVLVFTEVKRIVIYLLNQGQINKDVVFRIQENVTTSLKGVISFNRGSASLCHTRQNYSDFFSIEIGVCCNGSPCLIDADEARYKKFWMCPKDGKTNHQTCAPLCWTGSVNERCDNSGKVDQHLLEEPSDKEIMHFVDFLSIDQFKHFLRQIHENELTQRRNFFENIQYTYQKYNASTIMFVALHELKNSKDRLLYENMFSALIRANLNPHLLCNARREKTEFDGIDPEYINKLKLEPTDTMLHKVAKTVTGPKVFQLGIELGLEVNMIEEIIYEYGSLSEYNVQVLRKWKQSDCETTVLKLTEVLENVDNIAMEALLKDALGKGLREIRHEI